MYSFCLKPNQIEPSGSCDFSQIDNARLLFKAFSDSTSKQTGVHLFAVNYNILKIVLS